MFDVDSFLRLIRILFKNALFDRTRFPVKSDRIFECSYCNYANKYSDADVKKHEETMHETAGQICQICSKCCHSKHELEWHIWNFHPEDIALSTALGNSSKNLDS
jgi:heterodisulfide reductase subunit A-like polyferredoxin